MQIKKNTYGTALKLSSLLMLVLLAWLTVSLPFVYAGYKAQEQTAKNRPFPVAAEEESSRLANTTEEKTSNSFNSLTEEYLHDVHSEEHHASFVVKYYKCHPSDLYFAFHPELISPPPEA
jgi:hypothetical protein